MDPATISMSWAFVCGASGGAMNTLTGNLRLLPAIEIRVPGTSRLLVLGLIGNVVVAGVASLLAWMIIGSHEPGPMSETGTVAASLAYAAIGFLSAHWATAEYDKAVLRRAVCKAAAAPATNPETIEILFHASPAQVYDIVESLMPRRADHR